MKEKIILWQCGQCKLKHWDLVKGYVDNGGHSPLCMVCNLILIRLEVRVLEVKP